MPNKIIFSEEQKNQIIQLWKENYTQEEIGKKFGCGRKPIMKIVSGIKKYYQDEQWLREQYEVNMLNKRTIAKIARVNEMCIHENMKKLGIKTNDMISRKRKYTYNHAYFQFINTEEKAYWLGFIIADGGIRYVRNQKYGTSEKRLSILLAEKDKNHLEKFRKAINTDSPIVSGFTVLNGKKFPNVALKIRSIHIVNDLIALGVIPSNKSNHEQMPNIPEELKRHFIRGLFDGDGCISPYNENKCCSWCIVSSIDMCNAINQIFIDNFDLNMTILPDTGIYKIETGTNFSIITIMDWLYKDATIYMERKYLIYQNWKQAYTNHKI